MSEATLSREPRRAASASDPYAVKPAGVPRLTALHRLVGVLLLFVVSWLAFGPALEGELVYDDQYIVAQNPQIAEWSGVWTSFTSSYWEFLDESTRDRVGYYRPLSGVLLTICYQLGGTDPTVYHWLNLLLHVAACVAAWRLGARLFRSQEIGFAAALLFAVHPLHVESVAWISALHDPLYSLFGFIALERFLAWREGGSDGMPWASGVAFLAALLSKDAAIALVPVALALDYGRQRYEPEQRGGAFGALLPFGRAYMPMFCALLVYLTLRVITYGELTAGLGKQTTDFGVSFWRLVTLRGELFGGALALVAWPNEMNLFRPFHPELPDGALTIPLAAMGAWAVLALIAKARHQRPLLAALLLLPAAIAPVLLRVESVGTFPLSDRFLYFFVIGFTLWLVGCAWRWLPRSAAWAVVVGATVGYGVQSFKASSVWLNERVLFEDALVKNPENPNVYWSLGRVELQEYEQSGDTRKLARARSLFERGMDLLERAAKEDFTIFATKDDHLQMNLGLAFAVLQEEQNGEFRDFEVPARIFQEVTVHYPDSERGWIGLGVARMLQQRPEEARAQFEKALEINPRSPEALNNLGKLALRTGDFEEAEQRFREAAKYRTGGLQSWMGLAHALEGQGRRREAFEAAGHAYEANPSASGPCLMLGTLAAAAGDEQAAMRWLKLAIERDPGNAEAHFTLSQVHTRAGRFALAAQELDETLSIQRDHYLALYNLGQLILRSEAEDAETRALHPLIGAYHYRPKGADGAALRLQMLDLSTRHVGLPYRLGVADLERGDLESAEDWARRALASSPDNAAVHQLLALVLIEAGRYADAREHALIAADAHVKDYDAQNAAGTVLLALNEPDAALPYLQRAAVLLPHQPLDEELKERMLEGLRETIAEIENP
ncbi:MAG: tetratricopeptide repeat protein [Planctomycetes bacterium]|nr:tetratricopeptide repeat protein [Planctomycetota bacterium]MCB9903065.1 tetratricopeptide repeat protein [Planctomycetota bacterium]